MVHLHLSSARLPSPPFEFSPSVRAAWELALPSPYRMVGSADSPPSRGAVASRLRAIAQLSPSCDALWVGGGLQPSQGQGMRLLRAWHLFERREEAQGGEVGERSEGAERGAGVGLKEGAEGEGAAAEGGKGSAGSGFPPPWLHASNALTARLQRGHLPTWRHRCGEGVLEAKGEGEEGELAGEEEYGVEAELHFWLGCLQGGATVCSVASLPGEGESVSHLPNTVCGEGLARILRRHSRLSGLRVLVLADGASPRRLGQLLGELSGEGHRVSYFSPTSREEDGLLQQAGWGEFCPACALPRAAECDTCGDLQSEEFIECRLQASGANILTLAITECADGWMTLLPLFECRHSPFWLAFLSS